MQYFVLIEFPSNDVNDCNNDYEGTSDLETTRLDLEINSEENNSQNKYVALVKLIL